MAAAMELDRLSICRKEAVYVAQDGKFHLGTLKYKGQQYSQLYFARLHTLRERIKAISKAKWPAVPVCNILGLEQGKVCVVVGTLYKQMVLKPTILDEYSKERSNVPLVTPDKFTHATDHLILEDESGRVKLAGDAAYPPLYVTGVVVGILGQEDKDGVLRIHEILEAGLPPQTPLPCSIPPEDKFVALVSGLKIGVNGSNPLLLQLLIDHLTGYLGEQEEQSLSAQVVHVVIVGNSVDLPQNLLHGQPVASKEQGKLIEPVKELDLALTQIAAAMRVDIMPGANDPANYSLPQQPLHRCLFPGAAVYSTFHSATNPHQFELDGVQFLGSSGQCIDDLAKYSEGYDPLDFMERSLRWRHLAPTAPDTLGCYPFTTDDPFVIESCPHVYFCGNQKQYASRLVKGPAGQQVRMVCIPRFSETGIAVLVNIRTLECHLVTLSTPSFQ
eukprot:TRINITY_DN9842_c0_g1_i2.p1 TRINITY_DN9842_c0_g1~~TRINITY_DN9842_c0_g1_i2.p1  ORF type:complete len:444 (+),score=70.47 TRINITY_DN9842_c0_g1_i2:176-1507(+)